MQIETERLIITEFTPDMAQVVQENSVDEDNKRFVPDEVWETVEEAEETLRFLISRYGSFDGPLVYPIIVKETKNNIGYVQLCPIDNGNWEIGYHIAKQYTGNGYATEAVMAFLPVIARQINISEIYGICLAENEASLAVMRKCGFQNIDTEVGLYQGVNRKIVKNVWRIIQMNATYEHKNEMTFIGFHTEIAPNEGYQKCPEFWDKEYAEKYARLWQTMKPETPVEAAILENGIGIYAICAENENGFAYWIAGLYKGGDVPEGLELFTFPESDWAIFTAKGPIPQSLQTLNTQVWNEWAPTIKTMYEIGSSSLEIYSAGNPQSPDYECGIWVPIKKKADLKVCQSCGMPMESEDVFGTNADGSINDDYCKYCYTNGEFIDKVSMEEYIEMCSQFGEQAGMTNEEMKAYCEKLFPTLKRWKK